MDSTPLGPAFTLLGEPTSGDLYSLHMEQVQDTAIEGNLTIPAAKLSSWLMARGCEFCAY